MANYLFNKLGVANRDEFIKLVIQFVKFGIVGISNTLVSLACYYLICYINPDLYLLGSIIGTIVSIANAFFWNDRFVFSGNDKSLKRKLYRLLKTYISYGGTSLLSIVLLWIEVDKFSLSKEIAPIVNLIITIPLNFVINKLWTFRNKNKAEDQYSDTIQNGRNKRVVIFIFVIFLVINAVIIVGGGY